MRTLKFNIEGQRIKKNPECDFSGIIAGTKGYLDCEFEFSREWAGLAKAAVFKAADYVKYMPLVNNRCSIPDEVTDSTRIHVSVVGKDNTMMLSTNTAVILQHRGEVRWQTNLV